MTTLTLARRRRKDRVIHFEDGTTAIMHQNCQGCGKVVDLILRQVSMEYWGKVFCWDCIERKIQRLSGR